jgi:hypothetical protein
MVPEMDRARGKAKRQLHPVPIPDRNAKQILQLQRGLGSNQEGTGSGFYLEAVTLEESIIADRLISSLVCAGDLAADSPIEKRSFGQLIQQSMRAVPGAVPVSNGSLVIVSVLRSCPL